MKHTIKWLTNAAFELGYGDTKVLTDPAVTKMAYEGLDANSYSKPDYVLISHLHFDHISEIRDLYKMYQPTIITGAQGKRELVEYLDANAKDVYPVYPETVLDFGNVKIRALYAIHKDVNSCFSKQVENCEQKSDKFDSNLRKLQATGSLEMVNYIITWPDDFTILVWGGEFSKMQENYLRGLKPDIAIMQYSSSRKDEFLSMVRAVEPVKVLPYHHDTNKTKEQWLPELLSFQKECKNFVIMDNKEEKEF